MNTGRIGLAQGRFGHVPAWLRELRASKKVVVEKSHEAEQSRRTFLRISSRDGVERDQRKINMPLPMQANAQLAKSSRPLQFVPLSP
jgi:hypothetical protein